MKRQRITKGAILKIPVDDYFCCAQILNMGSCAFFDCRFYNEDDIDINVLKSAKVLFIVGVYSDIITRGIWEKIGKLPIREDLVNLPNMYIRHGSRYDLYNPNTGEITPSCREEAVGLECCAVWDDFHVVDRLRCRYNGTHCTWLSDELEYLLEIYDE